MRLSRAQHLGGVRQANEPTHDSLSKYPLSLTLQSFMYSSTNSLETKGPFGLYTGLGLRFEFEIDLGFRFRFNVRERVYIIK